jgi:5-methylcytosine-specific restriction endonuclease McrA
MSGTGGSAKGRIKAFFLDNVGVVVTAKQLQEVAQPVSEWARRVRELRDEEGWPIITHHDSADLSPGQYMLERLPDETPPKGFQRGISQKLRAEVLDRDGFTCQMCGKAAGEIDEETGRKVRLHIGHIVDKSLGGRDELGNLRTLCSTCNQGAKNVTAEKPSAIWLLAQVRRAGVEEQSVVYEFLRKKFGLSVWHGDPSRARVTDETDLSP